MADYYARRNGVLIGPFAAYDETTGYHAKQERHHQPRADDMTVLLNMHTVKVDSEDELRQLLKYDPILRAIYDYGRVSAFAESAARRDQ